MNHVQIGDVSVSRVVDYTGSVGLTGEGFFPGSDPELWQRQAESLAPDFLDPSTGLVQTAVQTWVVRSEGRVILVDTGLGNDKERPYVPVWSHHSSNYLQALADLQIRPEQVDVVVNTHLHLDHVGWNTRLVDRTWVPTFPNATYFVHQADFNFWNPANGHQPGFGRGNQNVFEDSVAPVEQAGQLQLWDGDRHQLDNNLTLELAAGHTPGQAVLQVASDNARAIFAGDVLHNPLQISHPELTSCFCEDPTAAAATRSRLLARAADQGALILPAHFNTARAARIRRDGGAFAIDQWHELDEAAAA